MPIPIFDGKPGPPEFKVAVAVTDSVFRSGLYPDLFPWIIILVIVLLISITWWIPMVRYLTNPIREMEKATKEISRGRFQVRVVNTRKDEIGRLGHSINRMAEKLDNFVAGQKRFLGDISHELGSPIGRMRMGLELLDQKVHDIASEELEDVSEEVEHMADLVDELLSFTKADLFLNKVELEPVELASVVQVAIEREGRPMANIITQIPQGSTVLANKELLSRALMNILRNAVRYASAFGRITISFSEIDGQGVITVSDEGPGVQPENLGQLFEPFFRQEKDRGRKTGGVGLGLAIVKTCINACKGTVEAQNLSPRGFAVTITLDLPK